MLSVDNLSLSLSSGEFSPKYIVQGMSFSLESNRKLGILGESGSGKTQTVLSICGLLRPEIRISSGTISFKDKSIIKHNKLKANSRTLDNYGKITQDIRGKEISVIFQDARATLVPYQTIYQQAWETWQATTAEDLKSDKEKFKASVYELLQELGFSDAESILYKYPVQLSGGQAQRAYIMLALIGDPDLLIADEPTSSLDPFTSSQIIELIRKLCEQKNISLIIISHDLAEIVSVTDNILVMYSGYVVEKLNTRYLKNGGKPLHPYTRFLFSMATGDAFKQLRNQRQSPETKKQNRFQKHVDKVTGCPYQYRCKLKKKLSTDLQRKCETIMPELKPGNEHDYVACWGADTYE